MENGNELADGGAMIDGGGTSERGCRVDVGSSFRPY